MKDILLFFAGIGIGITAGVIGLIFPNWNNFAWWIGGNLITILVYETSIIKERKCNQKNESSC